MRGLDAAEGRARGVPVAVDEGRRLSVPKGDEAHERARIERVCMRHLLRAAFQNGARHKSQGSPLTSRCTCRCSVGVKRSVSI
eukprot:2333628-Pleurochrysis_carterae.AAC.2